MSWPLAGPTDSEARRIDTENEPSGSGQRETSLFKGLQRMLMLNCLVIGDDSNRIFTVEIEADENSGLLKDRIKALLGLASIRFMVLWDVSIAIDSDLNKKVKLDVKHKEPMLGNKLLSAVFAEPLNRAYLHVIVDLSASCEFNGLLLLPI